MAPQKKNSQKNVYRKTIGGMIGGLCEALSLHPMDTIKTRLQLAGRAQKGQQVVHYNGMFDCGKQIVTKEGVRSLYKGLTPFSIHLVSKYFFRYSVNFQVRALIAGNGKDTTFLQNILAGMTAGTVEALVIVTPFEVVKTRLQAQVGAISGGGAVQLKYKGPVHCLSRILAKEGVSGLWKGAGPTVFRQATNQASMFTAYTWLRQNLWGGAEELKPWQAGINGLMAATVGPLLNGPSDVIKTRLMNQTASMYDADQRYKGPVDALIRIVRTEGVPALYKGIVPRLARVAPGQAITWMAVEQFNTVCNTMNWF